MPPEAATPHRTPPVIIAGMMVVALALAAVTFLSTRTLFGRAARGPTATATAPVNPALDAAAPPGAGVFAGRLVDAESGLPVTDAGVTLIGPNRRALSGPDGRFRFDGVPPGPVTVTFGPVDGYVPRTVVTQAVAEGLDIGVTPLLPVTAPTYIVPEFGGLVPGCRDTALRVATAALTEPVAVSLTCVDQPGDIPAPAPSGRLPLAVVDAAPALVVPHEPVNLTVTLPSQPRYGAGVMLDLSRLDLDRLTWLSAGQLTVDRGGRTASGTIDMLGTYLVTAPPFGKFQVADENAAGVNQFSITGRPEGPPVDVFPPDTPLVYANFDYARMDNTPILVRTVDGARQTVFESRRPYSGDGHDSAPMPAPDNRAWPIGAYVTTLYVGEPPVPADSGIAWRIAAAPTPVPTPRIVPQPPPIMAALDYGVPAAAGLVGCGAGSSWWAKVVQPGDTLSALAARSGTSVHSLIAGNCLTSDVIRIGQVVYLPRPPVPLKPRYDAAPPPYSKPPPVPIWPTPVPPAADWPSVPTPAVVPTMPGPGAVPSAWPGFPESTPWKQAPPPGGWTAPPPVAPPTWVAPPQQPIYPTLPPAAPIVPPAPPAPPPASGPPVGKWTPMPGPEPTLAPRPTIGP